MNDSLKNITDSQSRYWSFMFDLITHIYYLENYLQHYQKIERYLNCFLAIVASASIASWAVWKNFPSFIWASIIALSQVINAIKHLLPFAKREEILRNMLPELRKLLFRCELNYYNVSNGRITDSSIHELIIEFKERKQTQATTLDSNVLPINQKFLNEATIMAKTYLQEYGG